MCVFLSFLLFCTSLHYFSCTLFTFDSTERLFCTEIPLVANKLCLLTCQCSSHSLCSWNVKCQWTYVLPLILLSSFFLSFFIRPLISELAEWNSTISGHMVGSKCDLKMSVQNLGYRFPYKSEAHNHLFWRFCNLTTTLTAYVLGMKHDIHKRASMLQTTRGLLHRLETTWTLVHKRLQIGGEFSPNICKICMELHCQASGEGDQQMQLYQTLPNGGQ